MKPPRHLMRMTLALCLLLLPLAAPAAEPPSAPEPSDDVVWSFEAKVTRLFDSHTSYEFADPFEHQLSPLSRLEFDLDGWWGGVEIKRWTPRWSLGLEVLTNLSRDLDGVLADSDWTEAYDPGLRTVYSESDLRMQRSYMATASADVSAAPLLGLPRGLDLRPTGGVRYQFFDLMAHDGTQWELMPDGSVETMELPGDAIHFKQTYWHYFLGLRLAWQPMVRSNPGFKLSLQADWAYVDAHNKDHHLLREGNRITEETTHGQAWHAALTLDVPIGDSWLIGAQAEYLTIDTSGSHRLYNDAPGWEMDFTWSNGVNVWSQQCSFSLVCSYFF